MSEYSSEDDEIPQYGRSTKNIIKELCAYDPVHAENDQLLTHNCYLRMIGVRNKRVRLVTTISEESTELMLEHIDFVLTEKELIEQR